MSIVETALKKAQQQLAPTSAAVASPVSRMRASAETNARQFRKIKLDEDTLRRNHVLPQITDQVVSRAYKILRTRTLQRLQANQWHSIAITGTESGQGKTLTAINLAVALAQDPNTWVFLVDLDLRRPQLEERFGFKADRGLGDYLAGDAEIDQIIFDTGIERLAVIPNSRTFEQSSELLAGSRMLELMRVLDAETPRRIVIYDLPPLLLSDDVLTFAPQVDGIMLVLSEGSTSRDSVKKSKDLLAEMNLIGVVLNRSAERQTSKYY